MVDSWSKMPIWLPKWCVSRKYVHTPTVSTWFDWRFGESYDTAILGIFRIPPCSEKPHTLWESNMAMENFPMKAAENITPGGFSSHHDFQPEGNPIPSQALSGTTPPGPPITKETHHGVVQVSIAPKSAQCAFHGLGIGDWSCQNETIRDYKPAIIGMGIWYEWQMNFSMNL
jgi:hypothetical protein